jgi:hypothetical protein
MDASSERRSEDAQGGPAWAGGRWRAALVAAPRNGPYRQRLHSWSSLNVPDTAGR